VNVDCIETQTDDAKNGKMHKLNRFITGEHTVKSGCLGVLENSHSAKLNWSSAASRQLHRSYPRN